MVRSQWLWAKDCFQGFALAISLQANLQFRGFGKQIDKEKHGWFCTSVYNKSQHHCKCSGSTVRGNYLGCREFADKKAPHVNTDTFWFIWEFQAFLSAYFYTYFISSISFSSTLFFWLKLFLPFFLFIWTWASLEYNFSQFSITLVTFLWEYCFWIMIIFFPEHL